MDIYQQRAKRIPGRFRGIGANCVAALLGTITPFCSCSSIPRFIDFTGAGLPLGVTFSFLLSSPTVDPGSLVLLMSIFGWRVAVVYVALGAETAYITDMEQIAASGVMSLPAIAVNDAVAAVAAYLLPFGRKDCFVRARNK